ncbi:hypothetical protein DRN69_01875 [Candidatus Pacearchaeota archaeon]|nr:MAG: hypothetical protein DRN69_01875 [Candidatus Pacearchaeota archaeon]
MKRKEDIMKKLEFQLDNGNIIFVNSCPLCGEVDNLDIKKSDIFCRKCRLCLYNNYKNGIKDLIEKWNKL